MDENSLTLTSKANICAGQVLQFMVLDETIGIATVMVVALRDGGKTGIFVRERQLAFSHMRGVLTQYGNDTEDLSKKKQPGEPCTQTTLSGYRDHADPEIGCKPKVTENLLLVQYVTLTPRIVDARPILSPLCCVRSGRVVRSKYG